MIGVLPTAGERLSIECDLPWVAELIEESAGEELANEGSTSSSIRSARRSTCAGGRRSRAARGIETAGS